MEKTNYRKSLFFFIFILMLFVSSNLNGQTQRETVIDYSELGISDSDVPKKIKVVILTTWAFFQAVELTNSNKIKTIERDGLIIVRGNCPSIFNEWAQGASLQLGADGRVGIITTSTPTRFGQHRVGVIQSLSDGRVYTVEVCEGDGDKLFIKGFSDINKLLTYYKGRSPRIIRGNLKDK